MRPQRELRAQPRSPRSLISRLHPGFGAGPRRNTRCVTGDRSRDCSWEQCSWQPDGATGRSATTRPTCRRLPDLPSLNTPTTSWLTTSSRSRSTPSVASSSPGRVTCEILVDSDHDGVADTYKQFADGPASGAQGMCFRGRDLICTGDAGLIRYRDANSDDRADGPPDVFLNLRPAANTTPIPCSAAPTAGGT